MRAIAGATTTRMSSDGALHTLDFEWADGVRLDKPRASGNNIRIVPSLEIIRDRLAPVVCGFATQWKKQPCRSIRARVHVSWNKEGLDRNTNLG